MQPIALGAWRLANAGLERPADVVADGQVGRYYTFEGEFRSGRVDELENAWQKLSSRPYALAASSATASLTLALHLVKAGGGEVVLPAYAFAACAQAILACGAEPVAVPCGDRLVPSPADVQRCLTSRTRAVMAVHMRGIPMDVAGLAQLLPDSVPIVEDCSQFDGLGAGETMESGHAAVTVYSFQAKKLVTAGEGGMMTFAGRDMALAAVQATDSGWFMRPRYAGLAPSASTHSGSRMNEATAALVLPQLAGLGEFCARLSHWRAVAEDLLGARALPLSLPQIAAGGTVALRQVDAPLRDRLRDNGFAVWPECGNQADPHRSSGWPAWPGTAFRAADTAALDDVALLQVTPDWDDDTVQHLMDTVAADSRGER